LHSVNDARAVLGGIGRTTLYNLIKSGRLPVVRIGRRTFIADDDTRALIDEHRLGGEVK